MKSIYYPLSISQNHKSEVHKPFQLPGKKVCLLSQTADLNLEIPQAEQNVEGNQYLSWTNKDKTLVHTAPNSLRENSSTTEQIVGDNSIKTTEI